MATRQEEKERRRAERVAREEAHMAQAKQGDQPKCVEVSVQASGGGKVAIKEYGKITSNWGVSFSRRYEVPDGWTDEQIDAFQVEQRQHMRDLIEPIDQAEFDERYEQRDW